MKLISLNFVFGFLLAAVAMPPQAVRAEQCKDKKTEQETILSQTYSFIGTFDSVDKTKTVFRVFENFGEALPVKVRFDTWKLKEVNASLFAETSRGTWILFTTDRPVSADGDLSLTDCSITRSMGSDDPLLIWLRKNAPNLKIETKRIMEGMVEIDVIGCWKIFGESYDIAFLGDDRICPHGREVRLAVSRAAAPRFPADNDKLKTIYAKGRDDAAFDRCAKRAAQHNAKSEYQIECGSAFDESSFRGFLKCKDAVFEISVHDSRFKFPSKSTSKMSLSSLPNEPYKIPFQSFRCAETKK